MSTSDESELLTSAAWFPRGSHFMSSVVTVEKVHNKFVIYSKIYTINATMSKKKFCELHEIHKSGKHYRLILIHKKNYFKFVKIKLTVLNETNANV